MAHFAKINENNIVEEVLVIPNEEEYRGQEYLNDDCNLPGTWIQCSYNGKIRNIYPGIGSIYLPEKDIFIHKKPFESWSFDEDRLIWKSPVQRPDSGMWSWDEELQEWKEIKVVRIYS